jgi:hypothetical protein
LRYQVSTTRSSVSSVVQPNSYSYLDENHNIALSTCLVYEIGSLKHLHHCAANRPPIMAPRKVVKCYQIGAKG